MDGGNRWLAEAGGRSGTYDRRWEELAAAGQNIHGEADLVESLGPLTPLGGPLGPLIPLRGPLEPLIPLRGPLGPRSVLDAGCGTGRVAIELARRGIDVTGIDVDPSMLEKARSKQPDLPWIEADLVGVDLERAFDVVMLAGNVMIFLAPGTEADVVANMARHVAPGGALVAGFSLEPDRLDLATYDRHARDAGLELTERWATWDRQPFAGGNYAVSVHRRSLLA